MAKKVRVDIKATGASKASKDLGKVDKGLSKLAKSAATAAAGFFGARMLLDGFRKIIDATREQVLAETQLNAVLKSTAGVAGLTAKELTGMASALQKQTRFGDEAIIKAQSLMLTFTKVGKEVFPGAIEAVLNMSEAMGQDLQQGVIQVGKALNDPILGVTALRRVGVQLSKQQEDLVRKFTETGEVAKAQKIILSELETQFGGVAKAAGETMAGSLDQMNNAAGDAAETLGKELEPMIVKTAQAMTSLLQAFSEDIEDEGLGSWITGKFLEGPQKSLELFRTFFTESLGMTEKQWRDYRKKIGMPLDELEQPEMPQFSLIPDEEDMAEDLEVYDDFVKGVEEIDKSQAAWKAANIKYLRMLEEDAHQERIKENLQSAILQGQSAKDAALSVIKAEVAEAQAGLISSIMKALPFPINLAVAAGAGGLIGKVTDKLFSFQTGGSFITKGRTTLPIGNGVMVGDNASGMERVDVTPLPAPNTNEGNITININAPVVDEYVVDSIIPAIERARKLNL